MNQGDKVLYKQDGRIATLGISFLWNGNTKHWIAFDSGGGTSVTLDDIQPASHTWRQGRYRQEPNQNVSRETLSNDSDDKDSQ